MEPRWDGQSPPFNLLLRNSARTTRGSTRFQTAMDDDLNTPGALVVLFELAKGLQREGNRLVHEGKTQSQL